MTDIMEYVKPELIVVSVVLYFIGIAITKSELVKNKFIPLILGVIGIVLSLIWVLANSVVSTPQQICAAAFTAIVQGVLVAGLSTYVNQFVKQFSKEE